MVKGNGENMRTQVVTIRKITTTTAAAVVANEDGTNSCENKGNGWYSSWYGLMLQIGTGAKCLTLAYRRNEYNETH